MDTHSGRADWPLTEGDKYEDSSLSLARDSSCFFPRFRQWPPLG